MSCLVVGSLGKSRRLANSPMPMLDVCDWLLLLTVSTTGGGRTVPCFFCWLSLLPPDGLLPYLLWMLPRTMVSFGLPGPMVVGWCGGVVLCAVFAMCSGCAENAVLNNHPMVHLVYNSTYSKTGARRPVYVRKHFTDDRQTCA